MNKAEVCEQIKKIGIIPAIRVSSAEEAHFAAEAVTQGGIPIVEITMTVPDAVALISHLVRDHEQLIVGAGTVLDTETARKCVNAGAHFLTAPGFDLAMVEFAAKANVTVFPGAFTQPKSSRRGRLAPILSKFFLAHLAAQRTSSR
jgi:2-dehydro-3-deoxyphosphogluconate aldolase/(4S)-4-hydroxy-2-oxoglutarate aldolase